MVKIRIQGLPDEVEECIQDMKSNFSKWEVLEVSTPYANRGDTKFVRVYVSVQQKTNSS